MINMDSIHFLLGGSITFHVLCVTFCVHQVLGIEKVSVNGEQGNGRLFQNCGGNGLKCYAVLFQAQCFQPGTQGQIV